MVEGRGRDRKEDSEIRDEVEEIEALDRKQGVTARDGKAVRVQRVTGR